MRRIPPRMDFLSEYFFQNKASLFPGVLNNLYPIDLGNRSVLGEVIYKSMIWVCKMMWVE